MSAIETAVVLATAVGAAYVGGTFYAFSTFVMRALGDLDDVDGARAMQAINRRAINPPYMIGLFGTAVGAAAVVVIAVTGWSSPRSWWLVGGAAAYLLGVFVMTAAYHVPRNNRLDAVEAESDDGRTYWRHYQAEWTRWNHGRAILALLAAALLVVGSRVG